MNADLDEARKEIKELKEEFRDLKEKGIKITVSGNTNTNTVEIKSTKSLTSKIISYVVWGFIILAFMLSLAS